VRPLILKVYRADITCATQLLAPLHC
jgi:hypothetical protein